MGKHVYGYKSIQRTSAEDFVFVLSCKVTASKSVVPYTSRHQAASLQVILTNIHHLGTNKDLSHAMSGLQVLTGRQTTQENIV
jgi:hypothetical protein